MKNFTASLKMVFAIIVTSIVLGPVSFVNAQIPNPGFENWHPTANGLDPVGWVTSNATPYISVEQYTPGYQGNFAVRVKAWQAGLSNANGVCQSDAFYYSSRPLALSGYMKCTIMPGDSVSIDIVVTQGGVHGVAVGAARIFYTSDVSSYTAFNLPIHYGSASATDSVYIDIIAGRTTSPVVGTEIIVDELSLSASTGVEKTNLSLPALIGQNYPNPSREFFTIPLTLVSAGNINIRIFDLLGREVKTIFDEYLPSGVHQLKFSVADLPDGIYYYAVHGNNFTGTRKFTVNK